MNQRLNGKVAIVTGPAASALVGETDGPRQFCSPVRERASLPSTVTPAPWTRPSRIRAEGGEVRTHLCDVIDGEAVAAMVTACVDAFGTIDILMNQRWCRGSGRACGPDLRGMGLAARLQLEKRVPDLQARDPGDGGAGRRRDRQNRLDLGLALDRRGASRLRIAKAAIIQFSRVTAVEYTKKRIRVNTVVPGQMHTPMVEARLAGQRSGGDVKALLASRIARIPLWFMGEGRDTASAALFLASDEARFITGTEIVVDGGMTARCD